MFAAMMRKLMYPAGRDAVACAGKGGNQGGEFMMERARQMLIAQGHDGDPSRIMMVGDRFDTDVRMHAHAAHAPCSRSGVAPL
jgi:ribonucleotide monophosphatase NagD (HAD superfamily)